MTTTPPRYNDLPERYWAYLPLGTRLLDRALAGGGGGGGGVPSPGPGAALLVVIAPIGGEWPPVTRVDGDRVMWLRHITSTTLAPIPTFAGGYKEGDLVYPLAANETLPRGPGPLFSDSFIVSADTQINGRYGDAALGGGEPEWSAIINPSAGGSRARIQKGSGLEVYSDAYAIVQSPKLPTAAPWRATVKLVTLSPGAVSFVPLAGTAVNSANSALVRWHNDAGTVRFQLRDKTTGTETTTEIGSAAYVAGATLVVALDAGRGVTVTYNGAQVGTASLHASATRLDTFAFAAGIYTSASYLGLLVETL